MKHTILTFTLIAISISLEAQRLYPKVQSAGGIQNSDFAMNYTDPEMEYHIVSETFRASNDSTEVHWALSFVSKMYNLHAFAGIPDEQLDINFVFFAGSTGVALTNEAYQKKYKTNNPNLALIDELTDAGVNIIVCGQSVMNWGLDPYAINPKISIAVSRLTAVTTMQLKGYAYFGL